MSAQPSTLRFPLEAPIVYRGSPGRCSKQLPVDMETGNCYLARSNWSKNSSVPWAGNHCSANIDDKSGPGGLLLEEIPGILTVIYVPIVSPPPAVPSILMPLPSRSTSAGLPVVLDTALLPCSLLPLGAKETKSDCLCPDGCAPSS